MKLEQLLALQQEVVDSYDKLEQTIHMYHGKPIARWVQDTSGNEFYISLGEEPIWTSEGSVSRYRLYINKVFPVKTFLGYGNVPIMNNMCYIYDCENSGVINSQHLLNSKQLIRFLRHQKQAMLVEVKAIQKDIESGEQRWEEYQKMLTQVHNLKKSFSKAFLSQKK